MDLTRRELLEITGTTALAMGMGRVAQPAYAQMKTVKIGTAVLADYGLVAPLAVAMEKG